MRVKIRILDDQMVARNARIRSLYEEGATIDQVAEAVYIHPTTVWRVLARAGVVRPRGWQQRLEQRASR